MQKQRDEARPSRLMRRPKTAPGIAMKEFMEQHVVAEGRIFLMKLRRAEHRSPSMRVAQKEAAQAQRQFTRDLSQAQVLPRVGWALHFEVIAVIPVELVEGFDDEIVDRHPNRPAPIGVSTEQIGCRFSGNIADAEDMPRVLEGVRGLFVEFRYGANAVIREELRLVQHAPQDAFHPVTAHQRQ